MLMLYYMPLQDRISKAGFSSINGAELYIIQNMLALNKKFLKVFLLIGYLNIKTVPLGPNIIQGLELYGYSREDIYIGWQATADKNKDGMAYLTFLSITLLAICNAINRRRTSLHRHNITTTLSTRIISIGSHRH